MSLVDQRIDVHCGRDSFEIHDIPVLSGAIPMRLGAPTEQEFGQACEMSCVCMSCERYGSSCVNGMVRLANENAGNRRFSGPLSVESTDRSTMA